MRLLEQIKLEALKQEFMNNEILKIVDEDLKEQLFLILDEDIDLKKVDDFRVATDFLKYLIKKKVPDLIIYFEDLTYFLKLMAFANQRHFVSQADLFLLTKLNFSFVGWKEMVLKALQTTMFRELFYYLGQNGDFKEELTNKLENHELTNNDKIKAGKLADWCKEQVEYLVSTRQKVIEGPQLVNIFFQDEIIKFYDESVDLLTRRLKFQELGFSVAAEKN